MENKTKTCTKCGETKPLEAFYKKTSAKDGRQSTCIECDSAYHRADYVACNPSAKPQKIPTAAGSKVCTKCGDVKAVRAFYKKTSAKDGRQSTCKKCNNTPRKPLLATTLARRSLAQKTKKLEAERLWREANPGKSRARFMKRHTAKLQRTPGWADLELIRLVYEYAATFEGYHVDHIVPLQGKTVSGLHVAENLRAIPAAENCAKSARFTPGQDLPIPTIETSEFWSWLNTRKEAA